ncbi:unknown [Prevotella sp. CAG:1185]|mgnify:CR=1 FL=1|nr:unknown [Prevotella sp. CAG:1185]
MPQQKHKKSAPVAELVDALDLGSSGWCRVGSSPIRRTDNKKEVKSQ